MTQERQLRGKKKFWKINAKEKKGVEKKVFVEPRLRTWRTSLRGMSGGKSSLLVVLVRFIQ